MQFLRGKSKIDFMSKRKPAMILSIVLIVISLGSLVTRGLNFGIDFTGGYLIEVGYEQDIEISTVRAALDANNFKDAQVQHFGTTRDILVRIAPREDINKASLSDNVLSILKTNTEQTIDMRRVEYVGPQVGEELRDQGGLAMLVALFFILVYVSFRFQFKSAVGAILAVIGYSLNDTVVVLDRIRETFRVVRKSAPIDILNLSINQTLARTLMTSFTTLIVLFALFFLGGEVIHGFAFALIIGVLVGTYSSIYVASSTLVALDIKKQDFLVQAKEEVVDDRP